MSKPSLKVTQRIRLSSADAHYAGGLVDGAKILQFFGDAATELLIRLDGEEGLFRAYHQVDFLAPTYAGDFLEITAEIIQQGNRSRRMAFEAKKVIIAIPDEKNPGRAEVLTPPLVVCRAEGTCIVGKKP